MSESKVAVGVIQFGTVSSWMVFSRSSSGMALGTFKRRGWFSDGFMYRFPTCVLLLQDSKTVHSFGVEAEKSYQNCVRRGIQEDYYFIRAPKELTYSEESCCIATISDDVGRKLKATTVLGVMIKGLIEAAKADWTDIIKDLHLHWVIIVTVRLNAAISLVQDAIEEAEINKKHVTIISRDDAAVCLLENLPDRSYISKPEFILTPGMQILTVITEDESVDTVLYRKEDDKMIRADGTLRRCEFKMETVEKRLEKLLVDMVGRNAFETFREESSGDFAELMIDLKFKLFCQVSRHTSDNFVWIRIPASLGKHVMDCNGKSLKDLLAENTKFMGTVLGDKIKIVLSQVTRVLETTLQTVEDHIQNVLKSLDAKPAVLFLVGEFVDAQIFQERIASTFPDMEVVVPPKAQKAVIFGAFHAAYSKGVTRNMGQRRPLVVASIDFGTTYSGWARSYRKDFEKEPTMAYARRWNSGSAITDKTPTCVLIRSDGKTVENFGYDAIRRYEELIQKEEERSYFFFHHFKMALHKRLGEKLERGLTIKDVAGKTLLALDVFAASIWFLKDDFMKDSSSRVLGSFTAGDVDWVLTVPAIWSDGAKQFMREAAVQAGINSQRLTLALEPEAASIYCRHLPMEVRGDKEEPSLAQLEPGNKYLVCDAGGGTVDVTIHEVVDEESVREIYAATGGAWGGTTIDNAFEGMIRNIFGVSVYDEFCKQYQDDRLQLLHHFEIKKRMASPKENSRTQITIPLSLYEMCSCKIGKSVAKIIDESKFGGQITVRANKLSLSADLFRSLFKASIESILGHLKGLLKKTHVSAILMVGGYSESPMLQEAVRSHFDKIRVVIPQEAGTCVMKGSLIYGHRPRQIIQRVLKYTYGIASVRPFYSTDPAEKRLVTDSGVVCVDVFDRHVKKGQLVNVGECQAERCYSVLKRFQAVMILPIYASELDSPQYVDKDCTLLGDLLVDFTDRDADLNRCVSVALTFSGTEITAVATDEKTGNEAHATMNFLG